MKGIGSVPVPFFLMNAGSGIGKGASFRMRTVREEATSPIGPVEDSSS